MTGRQTDRAGFTLIELAVVVMIVGILAGMTVPAIQYAVQKADASHIVSDANTIRIAAYQYLSDNGVFPASGSSGTVPVQLEPYLPANFPFTYKDVRYTWFSLNLPWLLPSLGTRTLGILIFDYSARPELATAMQAVAGPHSTWGPTQLYFLYYG